MRNSINDERVLIGAAIMQGDKHLTIDVSPSDFESDFLGSIWAMIIDMKDVDLSAIETKFFDRRGEIAAMVSDLPTFVMMDKVASRVTDASHRRRLLAAIEKSHSIIKDGGSISEATNMIDRVAAGISSGNGWSPIADGLMMAYKSIDKAMTTGENINFISTGIKSFDDEFGGMQKDGLIVISGRPGSGKSSLAAGFARWSGRTAPCLITTFEMGREQMCMRYFGMEAKVDMSNAMKGQLSQMELSKLYGAVETLAESGIYINDETFRTASDIAAEARRFKRVHDGMGMLIVDHLGLIDKEGRNNIEFIEDTTRKMKLLAGELQCPVLLLVQMNRNVEGRANAKPQMSDLRGCGSIEADADQIIFPVIDCDEGKSKKFKGLDDSKPKQSPEGNASIFMEKNRNGTTGDVRVQWVGANTTYKDIGGFDEDF